MKIMIIILCLLSFPLFGQSQETMDSEQIKMVITQLTQGQDQQNAQMLEEVFRDGAVIYATNKGGIISVPPKQFAQLHGAKKFGGHQRNIEIVDIDVIDGLIANAKVIAENKKVHYTYFLDFSKVDEKWLIQSYLQHSKMK